HVLNSVVRDRIGGQRTRRIEKHIVLPRIPRRIRPSRQLVPRRNIHHPASRTPHSPPVAKDTTLPPPTMLPPHRTPAPDRRSRNPPASPGPRSAAVPLIWPRLRTALRSAREECAGHILQRKRPCSSEAARLV